MKDKVRVQQSGKKYVEVPVTTTVVTFTKEVKDEDKNDNRNLQSKPTKSR